VFCMLIPVHPFFFLFFFQKTCYLQAPLFFLLVFWKGKPPSGLGFGFFLIPAFFLFSLFEVLNFSNPFLPRTPPPPFCEFKECQPIGSFPLPPQDQFLSPGGPPWRSSPPLSPTKPKCGFFVSCSVPRSTSVLFSFSFFFIGSPFVKVTDI